MYNKNIKIPKRLFDNKCKESPRNKISTEVRALQHVEKIKRRRTRVKRYWVNTKASTLRVIGEML